MEIAQNTLSKDKLREFVDTEILPNATRYDLEQTVPKELFAKLAQLGLAGCQIPVEYGGQGADSKSLLMIHEEMGRGHSSIQNYLTVFGMFAKPLIKFGTTAQKEKWLPSIANGTAIPAIAITEPNIGSDVKEIETTAEAKGDKYVLNGKKKYITLGQIADVFIVAARSNKRGITFLVEKGTPGFRIKPMNDLLGLRANLLAELHFDNCEVPAENMVGREGFGLTHIISFALDEGRFTTACGCVGLGQACLEQSIDYARERKQFNLFLREHQLIKKMLTEIIVQVEASRNLCAAAAAARDFNDPTSVSKSLIAKYFSSKMAVMASNYAVQIQGAHGCTFESHAQRYFRDAKLMEIIEGASQMYELYIPNSYSY